MEEVGLIAIFDTQDFNRGLSDYLGGVDRANKAAERGEQQGFNFAHALEVAVGVALVEVARLAVDAALKLGDLFVGTVEDAISVEAAFAGVIKTTDGLAESTGELTELGRNMKQEFRNLAKEIPLTVEELMAIGEIGGQLGVAEEDLLEFTEVIAGLGVATNMTAEDAAISIAQFGSVAGMTSDELDNFASSIVYLGNNTETTEKDIMNLSSRIVGAGTIAGLAESEIAGIAAAFSSVGVTAEAGGTAISKVMMNMNTAVATGSDQVAQFAEVAGISAQEFADLWEEDAASAFTMFVEGLGAAGDDAITMLEDLELKDSRLVESFLKLGQAGDKLQESIDDSNRAFRDGNALADEANSAYNTTEAQLQLLQNNMRDFGLSIADSVLPYLNPFIEALIGLAEKYGPGIAEAFANIMEKAEPFIQFLLDGIENGDLFTKSFESIKNIFSTGFSNSIISVGDAMKNLLGEKAVDDINNFVQNIIPAFNKMKNTVLVVGGILGKTFSAFWETLKPIMKPVIDFINTLTIDFDYLATEADSFANFFQAVGIVIVGVVELLLAAIIGLTGGFVAAFEEAVKFIENYIDDMQDVFDAFASKDIKKILKAFGKLFVNSFKAPFEIVGKFVEGFVKSVIDFFENLKKELVGNSIIPDMMDAIERVIENVLDAISRFIKRWIIDTIKAFSDLAIALITDWSNAWDTIRSKFETVAASIKTKIDTWISNLKLAWDGLVADLKEKWNNMWDGFATGLVTKFEEIKTAIGTGLVNLLEKFEEFMESFKQKGRDIVNNVVAGVEELLENVVGVGASIVSGIAQGIKDNFSDIADAIEEKLNGLAEALKDSLLGAALVGAKIVSKIAEGIKNLWDQAGGVLKTIMSKFASFLADLQAVNAFSGIVNAGVEIVEKLKEGVNNAWSAFVDWIKSKLTDWFGGGGGGNDPLRVPSPGGLGVDLPGGNGNGGFVDRSRTINVEVNPTYTNVQSEAGIYHDVLAALQAVGT